MIDLFSIKLISEPQFIQIKEDLISLLPEPSRKQVFSYKKNDDLQRSLLGEVITRIVLSDRTGLAPLSIEIARSAKGKPYLPQQNNLHFNISHSGDWVVVGCSEQDLGIDIEKIREPQYRIASRYFSNKEVDDLNKLEGHDKASYFFDLWTLKESYLKLLGKGLTKSLGSFTLVRQDNTFQLEVKGKTEKNIHFFQHDLDEEYKFSVCGFSSESNKHIRIYNIHEILSIVRNYAK